MKKLASGVETLVTTLLALMPTLYQRQTLEALFGLLLTATGRDLPDHCQTRSPAAISRFLNGYKWPTKKLIRIVRVWIIGQLLSYRGKGRKPHLRVIIDLTTLEKTGKFEALEGVVRVFNGKRAFVNED
ncbi:hypothetical protein V0288_24655 [Pannus brasiliensis CCIBt3594]|uniref:Transposase n=1 Tax=Pannus brasiliensis CCIBt3594 TaxID=1427578 RepID=A0AAW9R0B1_9CHRO